MARPNTNAKAPQTMNEMVMQGAEQKKTSKLYKAESMALSDDRISDTINNSIESLKELANKKPITLKDTARVKTQTIMYFQSCATVSKLPSFSGLANALGMSRNALYSFMRTNPQAETTKWLEVVKDMMSDMLSESALRNNTNTIISIFLLKSIYGLVEKNVLDVNTNSSDPLSALPDISDVMAKYGYTEKDYTEEERQRMLENIPSEYR